MNRCAAIAQKMFMPQTGIDRYYQNQALSNLDFLVAIVNKLVRLPDIYYRLESAIESPASTVEDFSRLPGTGPGLCARLLSLANSVFYSFPAKIETIDRAVHMIGLRQIYELVLVTTLVKTFSKDNNRSYQYDFILRA